MSIERVGMFRVMCDWPGCEATADDDGEYSGWGETEVAEDSARDASWLFGTDGTHFCDHHPATWVSDHENGEPYPAGAYLLIHDGDTGNPDDDGNVTLIQPGDGGLEEVALALERQRDDETVHHEACSLTEAVAIIREWARS